MEYKFDWDRVPFDFPLPPNFYGEIVFPELQEQLEEYFYLKGTTLSDVIRSLSSIHFGQGLTRDDILEFKSLYGVVAPCLGMLEELRYLRDQGYIPPPKLRRVYELGCKFVEEYRKYNQAYVVSVDTDSHNTQNEIFTPVTVFNMSALYSFMVDEGIVVGIDEEQFANCINQANIKPLWETTGSKNKVKLALQTLKWFYQDTHQRQRRIHPTWYLECCESIGRSTQDMSKMKFLEKTKVNFCEKMKDSIMKP